MAQLFSLGCSTITMSLGKRVIVAVISGLGLSGIGVGMMALGGIGPCGPASLTGAIGWWANMEPCIWLSSLVPGLEALVGRLHADFVFITLWPAFLWSLVVFLILSVWSRFRRNAHKAA